MCLKLQPPHFEYVSQSHSCLFLEHFISSINFPYAHLEVTFKILIFAFSPFVAIIAQTAPENQSFFGSLNMKN